MSISISIDNKVMCVKFLCTVKKFVFNSNINLILALLRNKTEIMTFCVEIFEIDNTGHQRDRISEFCTGRDRILK